MGWSTSIVRTTSRVMNPFLLGVAAVLLAAFASSGIERILLNWVGIIILFLVVLPFAYAYGRTLAGGAKVRRIEDPLVFLRRHRREIGIVGVISVLPCILLLVLLEAPTLLVAVLVALLTTSLAVTLVNIFYRASYHLAITTILVIVVALVWGQAFLPILALVPLVGWARYALKQHSPAQLAAGACLAVVIAGSTFYIFGLLEDLI